MAQLCSMLYVYSNVCIELLYSYFRNVKVNIVKSRCFIVHGIHCVTVLCPYVLIFPRCFQQTDGYVNEKSTRIPYLDSTKGETEEENGGKFV